AQDAPDKAAKTLAERLGYPASSRLLIIHADDFGMMHSVNTAIEEAFEKHWITSASILVPCPWFPEVAQWAKTHPEADLGIHLALNADWSSYRWSSISPQSKVPSLLDADGYLPLTTEYVAAHAKMPDVETETHAQVDKAKAAGIHISHVDTHMGTIVSTEDLIKVYLSTAQAYKVPAMLIQSKVEPGPFLAHFHLAPETIMLDNLVQIMPGVSKVEWLNAYKKMLQPLPPGTHQLIVHLAHNDAEMQGATFDHPDWGAEWRQNDFDLVRSAEFQQFLKDQGFILISWQDLSKVLPAQ
ncbi:MAG: polysaccharide deacetylase family protein, partial [Acidobacteriota bacterium]|nr:polysaccharide deacetylase family protein [Acidobacteriota bacterium]